MLEIISKKKTCNNYKNKIEQELDKIETALKLDNAYGGFEGKLENGELVHFKYWISRKIKV